MEFIMGLVIYHLGKNDLNVVPVNIHNFVDENLFLEEGQKF